MVSVRPTLINSNTNRHMAVDKRPRCPARPGDTTIRTSNSRFIHSTKTTLDYTIPTTSNIRTWNTKTPQTGLLP